MVRLLSPLPNNSNDNPVLKAHIQRIIKHYYKLKKQLFFNEKETHQAAFFLVLNPTIKYNGQKLITLVSANTPPTINKTRPDVPLIIWVKYSTAITTAISTLKTRSTEFKLLFIFLIF